MQSEDNRLSPNKFDETREMMGKLAREMKNFIHYVHRSYPENSEYHTLQLLVGIVNFIHYVHRSYPENSEYHTLQLVVGIISHRDHAGDDAGEKGRKGYRKNDKARG